MGYKTRTIAITPNVRIKLEPDAQAVEAVVVTGMTKTDKRLFTGASDQLVADDVKLSGMADISRGLEGRSAGVSVQNVSGTFGTAPKIRVRGATSIFGSSKPLWVVDGIIMEDVVDIDARCALVGRRHDTDLFGHRRPECRGYRKFQHPQRRFRHLDLRRTRHGGVIVITTKKGRAGVSRINYTGEFTYRMIPSYNEFNIMNSQDQMAVYEEMRKKGWLNLAETANRSESGVYGRMYNLISASLMENTPEAITGYLRSAEYRNTDWFQALSTTTSCTATR